MVPWVVETPPGVILVTVFELILAVYTLPFESRTMANGLSPVLPRMVDTTAADATPAHTSETRLTEKTKKLREFKRFTC